MENQLVNLRGKGVAIATPCYGGAFLYEYEKSLLRTISAFVQHGIIFEKIICRDEAIVTRARNSITSKFLETKDLEYIWFVDADMEWEPDAILRLLALDKEVSGVAGMRKVDEPSFCANLEVPFQRVESFSGLVEVNELGTGFLLVKRSALNKIIEQFPQYYTDAKTGQNTPRIFEEHVDENGFYWSEDYMFCKKWRATGGSIWCDTHPTLGHVGRKVWRGAFEDLRKGKI